jgi:hypothetical protein
MGKKEKGSIKDLIGISQEYMEHLALVVSDEMAGEGTGSWTKVLRNSVKRLDPKDAPEAIAIGWVVPELFHEYQRKQKFKEILGEITEHLTRDENPQPGSHFPPLNNN